MPKSIDECEASFEELATSILPAHYSRLKENMNSPFPASWVREKGVGQATLLKRLGRMEDFPGCYVFIEDGEPLYVGISRCVISRLFQHLTSNTHFSGSLAYYIAKRQNNPGGTREQNMKNDKFRTLFEESKRRQEKCTIATVEIENPVELHLFEVYAAMKLGTGEFNTFRTH
ncbi:MAG: hypothetical protein K9J85_11055 [Desulfobacteraceae bacterium]|nr:hypothetical protein [Desulfobacteraceae bacterium]